MSVCVPHPNFGCLIRHCVLFCQNASGVYASGPGPWEVSLASSGTLRIVTPSGWHGLKPVDALSEVGMDCLFEMINKAYVAKSGDGSMDFELSDQFLY